MGLAAFGRRPQVRIDLDTCTAGGECVATLHDYFMTIRKQILDQKLALEAAQRGAGKPQ